MRPARHGRPFSAAVQQQLKMYALAASAAGVGLAAISAPTEAEIIYTPADVQILPNHTVPLDLNQDGVKDFKFKDVHTTTTFGFDVFGTLSILPVATANAAKGHRIYAWASASALLAGAKVGSKGHFVPGPQRMASEFIHGGAPAFGGSGTCSGPWANVKRRYLGLKFQINGEDHFGWARLNVNCPPYTFEVTAKLTGYAYETVAGKSIRTGQTHYASSTSASQSKPGAANLGQLAQGAAGLKARERRKDVSGE